MPAPDLDKWVPAEHRGGWRDREKERERERERKRDEGNRGRRAERRRAANSITQ